MDVTTYPCGNKGYSMLAKGPQELVKPHSTSVMFVCQNTFTAQQKSFDELMTSGNQMYNDVTQVYWQKDN